MRSRRGSIAFDHKTCITLMRGHWFGTCHTNPSSSVPLVWRVSRYKEMHKGVPFPVQQPAACQGVTEKTTGLQRATRSRREAAKGRKPSSLARLRFWNAGPGSLKAMEGHARFQSFGLPKGRLAACPRAGPMWAPSCALIGAVPR